MSLKIDAVQKDQWLMTKRLKDAEKSGWPIS